MVCACFHGRPALIYDFELIWVLRYWPPVNRRIGNINTRESRRLPMLSSTGGRKLFALQNSRGLRGSDLCRSTCHHRAFGVESSIIWIFRGLLDKENWMEVASLLIKESFFGPTAVKSCCISTMWHGGMARFMIHARTSTRHAQMSEIGLMEINKNKTCGRCTNLLGRLQACSNFINNVAYSHAFGTTPSLLDYCSRRPILLLRKRSSVSRNSDFRELIG